MVALLRSCENTEFMIGHFDQIYNEIVQVLKDKLPENLTYHNLAHTLYVLDKAMHIGRKEGVNDDDMYLLKIAALYHDSGFIVDPKNHEYHSCLLAKEYLAKYDITPEQLEKITGMIMATKLPQSPQNNLEAILADADLYYLSTNRFDEISGYLYQEWLSHGHEIDENAWAVLKNDFVGQHHYHTLYCKNNREKLKKINVQK